MGVRRRLEREVTEDKEHSRGSLHPENILCLLSNINLSKDVRESEIKLVTM